MQWLQRMWRWRIWLIVAVLLLSAIALSIWWWAYRPTPTDPNQPYSSIVIGTTTEQQLTNQLGQPFSRYSDNDYTVITEKTSKSPYRPDRFYLKDGIVVMKEQWFEPTYYHYDESAITDMYGTPEKVMYDGAVSDVVVRVDLYPSRGVAAYIDDSLKAVWHVQYFRPMSLDTYLASWGKRLVENKTSGQPIEPSGN